MGEKWVIKLGGIMGYYPSLLDIAGSMRGTTHSLEDRASLSLLGTLWILPPFLKT